MKIYPQEEFYQDRLQSCAEAGAALAATGVKDSAVVIHGPTGCNIMTTHIRTEHIPTGSFVPIVSSGLHPSDYIFGGSSKLEKTLKKLANDRTSKRPRLLWAISSCGTSIIGDDIHGIATKVEKEIGIPVIAVDAPGFKGGFNKGAELVFCALMDKFVGEKSEQREGINIIGPYLMGSKNWPNDLLEIKRLLEACDVKVNTILTHETTIEDLSSFGRAEANYVMTYEDMPEFMKRCEKLNIPCIGHEDVIPLGVYNTKQWYLKIAKRFGDEEKAKLQLKTDMEEVRKILRYNFNASWLLNAFSGKDCALLGYTPFAVSMARFLFYDLNVRPRIIALLAETPQALKKAKTLLEEMAEFLEFEIMENPSYLQYRDKITEIEPDFVIGQRPDAHLAKEIKIPHLSLGGWYFFNQFNFTPNPYVGIRGVLTLLSELGYLMKEMFQYPERSFELSYKGKG